MRPIAAWLLIAACVLPAFARAQDLKTDILQKKIKDLQSQLDEQDEAMKVERGKTNAMSAKALSLEHQLEEALAKIKELEARIAELEALLKAEKDKNAGLEKDLAAAKARIAELEKLLADEQAKNKTANDRIAELERLLAAEREKNANLEKRVGELEAKLAELNRQNGALTAQLEAQKGAIAELEKRKAEADARVAEFKALIAKFKNLIDAGKLRVKIVDCRMVVELATDVLFASGSASLSSEGKKAIVEVAQVLASIPDRKFQVEGHTDNVPISTEQFPSNWELAAARAITVVKTMLGAGMPGVRISAASYADVRPAMPNDTKEGKKANRRIEIVLVPDLSSLPGFEELQKVSGAN